jgi:hypothetical protein
LECRRSPTKCPLRTAVQKSNQRHGPLLRARRERPRRGNASESDKLPPPHFSG